MNDEPQLPAVAEKPRTPVTTGHAVAALVPQSLEEAYRLANAMAASGLTPNGIKTPEAVLVAIMAGAELGLAPFQACQSFAIIGNRPSLWGDAIPALLWSNGFKIKEWLTDESADYSDDMAARCQIERPDGTLIERAFSVADAKKASLWSKDGPWKQYPKRMLQMRARSLAARDGAPDLLRGLFIAEEAQDYGPAPGVNAGTGMLDRLNAREVKVDEAGFNVNTIEAEVAEAPKKRTRKSHATQEPEVVVEPSPQPTTAPEVAQAETDILEGPKVGGAPYSAQASLDPQSAQTGQLLSDTLAPGLPLSGETYLIANEIPANGRRQLYKDGQPFSTTTAINARAYKAYEGHPASPEPQAAAVTVAEPTTAAEAAAPASELGAATEAGIEPTGDDTGPQEDEQRQEETSKSQPTSDVSPASETDGSGFVDFADAVAGARDWPAIDESLADLQRAPAWTAADKPTRNTAWRIAYVRLRELTDAGYRFDFLTDLRAWRAYMEWETDLDALNGNRDAISRSEAWAELDRRTDDSGTKAKIALDRAYAERVTAIKTEGGG